MNLQQLPYDTLDSDRPAADLYLKPERASHEPILSHLSGDMGENALNNWKNKMNERKQVQNDISSIL